jgi:hypothetical protein
MSYFTARVNRPTLENRFREIPRSRRPHGYADLTGSVFFLRVLARQRSDERHCSVSHFSGILITGPQEITVDGSQQLAPKVISSSAGL